VYKRQTYDEPISATTVTSRTFAVHAMQTGLLTATHGVANAGNTIVVTPTHIFHPGELVQTTATTDTLNLSGQGPISPTVWQFRAAVGVGNDLGSGVFAAHPSSPTFGGGASTAVVLGDVDGDGDLDAIVANDGGAQDVHLNDGTGRFAAHPISPTFGAGESTDVALGDVDGDGDLDALVANYSFPIGQPQDVYLNDGTGRFAAHPISPTFGACLSYAAALGDVDDDGDLDALVANYTQAQDVYLNDGTGRFAAHPISPTFGAGRSRDVALGDVDGDGDLDAIVANYSFPIGQPQDVYLNDGTGRFAAHPISPTFGAGDSWDVALGDVDGDGDLDALVANSSNQAQDVHLNDGTGCFAAHPSAPTFGRGNSWDVALGDVDGDGDLDAIVANYNEPQDVYLNDGTGRFAAHPISPTFGVGDSASVALGDVDGDGDLDAIVANYSFLTGQPQDVYLNDGTGRFASHPISPTFGAGESRAVALGDVDGDGDLDAIVANSAAAQTVWLNRHRVTDVEPLPNSHSAAATTNLTVTVNGALGQTSVTTQTLFVHGGFHGHLSGTITSTLLSTGSFSSAAGYSDIVFDPDDDLHPGELVQTSVTTGVLDSTGLPLAAYVWQFRAAVQGGNGAFAAHPVSPTFGAGDSTSVAVGDVDGDGDLDAVVANYSGAQDVYLNDGGVQGGTPGRFAAHPISPTFGAGDSWDVALGDVDGDGDLDALVANYGTAQDVYLNDGTGRFATHPISPTFGANYSRDVALGDVDGDGDLDAIVANAGAAQDVYLNDGTGRFAAHPSSPTFGAGDSRDVTLRRRHLQQCRHDDGGWQHRQRQLGQTRRRRHLQLFRHDDGGWQHCQRQHGLGQRRRHLQRGWHGDSGW